MASATVERTRSLNELYSGMTRGYGLTDKNIGISMQRWRTLLIYAIDSMKALQGKQVRRLDGVVGECACQIRAAYIAYVVNKQFNPERYLEIENACQSALEQVEALYISPPPPAPKEDAAGASTENAAPATTGNRGGKGNRTKKLPKPIDEMMKKGVKLATFFVENELQRIPLTNSEMFMIEAFFLTVAKKTIISSKGHSQDVDSVEQLRTYIRERYRQRNYPEAEQGDTTPCWKSELTAGFFRDITKYTQRDMSKYSSHFVRQIAEDIPAPSLQLLREPHALKQDEKKKDCLPMFWTYKALLAFMARHDIPLIFRAKLVKMTGLHIAEPNETGNPFTPPVGKLPQEEKPQEPFALDSKGKGHASDAGPSEAKQKEKGPPPALEETVFGEKILYFRPDQSIPPEENPKFVPIVNFQEYSNRVAMVVAGIIDLQHRDPLTFSMDEWTAEMVERNVDVIYAGAAHHAQFPNDLSRVEMEGDGLEEYRRYKNMAEREGMSSVNMSFFFIRHTYPGFVGGIPTPGPLEEPPVLVGDPK